MRNSLWTRLYLTIALLLAVSIAASALLSRRATLVEVREMVKQSSTAAPPLRAIAARVAETLERGAPLDVALRDVANDRHVTLVVVDSAQHVVAASRPELAAARVRRATPDGDLTLDVTEGGATTALAVRGAPPVEIVTAGGRTRGMLYAVPSPDAHEPPAAQVLTPLVVTNVMVIALALLLTYALSRRILRPVGELRAAAERMQRGDLDVQVGVQGHDEIAELGRTFNSMASRLAQNERLRRQMASDVAHELRSPVTNLRCTLEAIQDGLAPLDRAGVDALHEETIFLQRLVADLQDLAVAEAGGLELHVSDVDVAALVRRAAAALAASAGAPIIAEVSPGLPRIRGDADRLEQVLRNLLSNARRHTPPGGTITISSAVEAGHLRIAVRDTGAGISREHLPYVFDRFYRVDPSRARATGGAGLGLAIARQLVAAHGGTIGATSGGAGHGTTVAIDLPLSR